ncbi:DNA polymerase subunit gamma-2, mitochondrial-like [Saccoglossus kowalevskii]|uniref:DNA polymerase subunit gamma-2, mitochondrial-like n=1 Tax=Saccoglossus kowalevskii TaxID=10224 RepID=A0ABM0M430_SACKO|nr:PREDICTED: DNA polymerase subunit gamma-2, mitochondrial-like [Saccoglossus kowalevskii]
MKIMDPFSDTGHDGNSQQQNVYLQPSCEKGILYNYPAVLKLLNQKLPFGLAEIARCFRKNIHDNSDKFLFNLPEFTQMSMQFYSPPSVATKWMNVWQRERIIWWRKFAGYPSKFHLTDIKMTETQQTVDIQYEFPWGVDSVEIITNRGDVDLVELERQSGINMQGRYGRKVVTPVVIETTAGLDRGMLAYLLDAYQEKERSDTRGKLKERKILRLHMKITPIKVVVHPIKNTRELREISEHLAKELRLSGVNTLYVCDAMTLDQHLVRFDEMGVPFTVIINEGTLKTGVIGMRSRDTALREQMHITEVKTLLLEHLKKE